MPRDPRTMASHSIRVILAALLGGLACLVAFVPTAGAAIPNSLAAPGVLASGQSLLSPGGAFSLNMQGDGNLVLYNSTGTATWNSGTWGNAGATLSVQIDGNLVVYRANVAIWQTHTAGPAGSVLTVQDDGNVVMTSAAGVVQWSSAFGVPAIAVPPRPTILGPTLTPGQLVSGGSVMRSANGNFALSMQTDGNLVVYDAISRPLFATNTRGGAGGYSLILQSDGNLVLYGSSGALWSSNTRGSEATFLILQDDGNLVLYNASTPVWWSGTRIVFGSTGNPDPSVARPNLINAATLTTGRSLSNGQSLTSPNGRWSLFMQSDGTLAVYGPGGLVHWTSNTPNHPGAKLTLTDGNLQATASGPGAYFNTRTSTGSVLSMQDDGNLVLYSATSSALWFITPSSPVPNGAIFQGDRLSAGQSVYSSSGAFNLTQQGDGNLVLYQGGVPRWWTSTSGHTAAYTTLQGDGNLVVYSSTGAPLFGTGTVTLAKTGSRLTVQDDGNLVLYDADGTPVWATSYSAAAPPGYGPTLTAPPSSTSHYVRNLSSNQSTNATIMTREGCADAQANPGGRAYLVLLDFGAQIDTGNGWGVILTVTSIRITNAAVISAVRSYIDGYVSCRAMPSYLTVAIGTNNDGPDALLGAGGGALWAAAVINPLSAYAATLPSVAIAGANDMEPGFNGTMAQAYDWLNGYLNATGAQFMFFGSADGCSTRANTPSGTCNNGWTMAGLYHLAYGAMPTRALAMPEIYSNALAIQWANISLTGVVTGNSPAAYAGPMTEVVACQQAGSCGSPSPTDAWNMLLAAVNANPRTRLTGMLYTTDLRIDR